MASVTLKFRNSETNLISQLIKNAVAFITGAFTDDSLL